MTAATTAIEVDQPDAASHLGHLLQGWHRNGDVVACHECAEAIRNQGKETK